MGTSGTDRFRRIGRREMPLVEAPCQHPDERPVGRVARTVLFLERAPVRILQRRESELQAVGVKVLAGTNPTGTT
jgi:hypothetical protein